MDIAIRTIGNSKGVVLPKPVLAQAGLTDSTCATISVEDGAIVLRKPQSAARAGWAAAAQTIVESGEQELLLGDFGNADDEGLVW